MPESATHDFAIDYLKALLLAWVARSTRSITVARNLGIRWIEQEPRFGFDPDLCLIEPSPPEEGVSNLTSLRLWEPGHTPPRLAIEVVSPGHPYKDYVDTPERCAASGVEELWIYDPLLAGPKREEGPLLLQLWRRDGNTFHRVYAGDGPAHSPYLDAWLRPTASSLPREARLGISDDVDGTRPWLTDAESAERLRRVAEEEREAEKRNREAAERNREAAERNLAAAQTRIAELEAALSRRS